MTSHDAGGKSRPANSRAVLGQENRQEHQHEGSGPKAGKDPEVLGQSTMGHDANSPAAGSEQAGDQAHRGQGEQHGRTIRDWGSLVAITNVILAFVGVGGLLFTAFQLDAMREQLDQMKIANIKANESIGVATRQAIAAESANKIALDALSASDRAWLFASATHEGPLAINSDFIVEIKLQNLGRTPAINANVIYSMMATNQVPQGDIVRLPVDGSRVNVFPGALNTGIIRLSTKDLEGHFSELISGRIHVYVFVAAQYEDIGKKIHNYKSCYKWDIESSTFHTCQDFQQAD